MKKSNNGIFSVGLTNVKSALVYVFLTAFVQVSGYVLGIGDVFKLDHHALINITVMSVLVGFVSIIKNFLTTDEGKFLGAVKVTEEK